MSFACSSGVRRPSVEHVVDHPTGDTEIIAGVAVVADRLRAAERRHDLRHILQHFDEAAPGFDRPAACVVDDIVRFLAAEHWGCGHHDGFSDDQSGGRIEIGAHATGVDDQAAEHEAGIRACAGRQDEALGDGDPFEMPGSGCALEVLYRGVDDQAAMLPHGFGGGDDQLAGDRVALLRHRARCAAPLHERLGHLAELGRHHGHDIGRDLRQRTGHQSKEGNDLGDVVAGDVPGDRGLPETELVAYRSLHLQTLVAQRGERSGGAAERGDEHPLTDLREACDMSVDHGQPHRRLVAEGHRQCVLHMGATGHRRVAITLGEPHQDSRHCAQVVTDDVERGTKLQDGGGIHDVLGGGAPVDVMARFPGTLGQLANERQDRIADDLGLRP